MQRPTVLIADDHQFVAECTARFIRDLCEVVGIVTEIKAIEGVVRELKPDILILDLVFGRESGMRLIPVVAKASAGTRIVILTAHLTVMLADAAIEAGAYAFILKAGPASELHDAIALALAGNTYVSPLVYSLFPGPIPEALRVTLSPIEASILDALASGSTQDEAGASVNRTRKDVEYHLARLRSILGLTRTAELLRWYQKQRGAR